MPKYLLFAASEVFAMDHLKKFGVRGCIFLAANKVLNRFKYSGDRADIRLPELKESPLVSVIIYGEGDREASLESLRRQSYTNFEVTSPEDARGDIAAFLSAGDILHKNALYLMLDKLQRSGKNAVYCDEEGFFKPDWSPDTIASCDYIGFFMSRSGCGIEGAAHCPYPLVKSKRNLRFFNESISPVEGRVSIIIPSKDNYEVLKRCIDSIKAKTLRRDYEIIITDNGSSPETAEKYRCLADKYIYEKAPFNFSHMCNIGAAAAEGRFLLFLNDDTEVLTYDWLDRLVYYAAKPHSGAVGAKLLYPPAAEEPKRSRLSEFKDNLIMYKKYFGRLSAKARFKLLSGRDRRKALKLMRARADKSRLSKGIPVPIQHCGVVNLQPGPAHILLGEDDRRDLYCGRNRGVWDCTAVTAACLMIEKSKFTGFDESLAVAYNDVELCLGMIEKGFYNMTVNSVMLRHYESLSRGDDRADITKLRRLALERQRLFELHPDFCGRDDFYNINLSPYRCDMSERNFALFTLHKCVKLKKLPPEGEAFGRIEYAHSSDYISIGGYACKKGCPLIYVVLEGEGCVYRFTPVREMRTDLDAVYGRQLLTGGFSLLLGSTFLPKGVYKAGIMLTDITGIKKVYMPADKTVRFI